MLKKLIKAYNIKIELSENTLLKSARAFLIVKDLEELGDQLDFGRFTFKKFDNSTERIDMNARIKSSASVWNEDFKNMIVDRGLRVVTDENGQKTIIDSRESVEDIKNFFKKAKDTTPGKILLKPFDLDDKHNFDILVAAKNEAENTMYSCCR